MEPIQGVGIESRFWSGLFQGRMRTSPEAAFGREPDSVELVSPGVRRGLVDRVRSQIEAGRYETEERLSAAAGAMFRSLASGGHKAHPFDREQR